MMNSLEEIDQWLQRNQWEVGPEFARLVIDSTKQLFKLQSASASVLHGLTMGPIAMWSCGEISTGRLRECIGEWAQGKLSWHPTDFGMEEWPKDSDIEPQTLLEKYRELQRKVELLENHNVALRYEQSGPPCSCAEGGLETCRRHDVEDGT